MVHKHNCKCLTCDKEFLGYRPKDKFCSDTCRLAWQHQNRTLEQKAKRKASVKKWGQENWLRRRNYMLLYTYGLSPEQYQEMLEKQDYSCATCKRHETEFSRKLAVDHDHKTGEIFGLLCQNCNHVLIGKHRDPKLFLAAAKYLEKGTGWIVPPKPKRKKKKCRKRRTKKASQ